MRKKQNLVMASASIMTANAFRNARMDSMHSAIVSARKRAQMDVMPTGHANAAFHVRMNAMLPELSAALKNVRTVVMGLGVVYVPKPKTAKTVPMAVIRAAQIAAQSNACMDAS